MAEFSYTDWTQSYLKKTLKNALVWFYGILTIVGYLMPNPFYTYKQFF